MYKRWRYLRYVLFFLSFLIITYSIKIFVQNFNMNKEISNLKNIQIQLSWDTLWMKKYFKPYVKTYYSKQSIEHSSWIPNNSEILINIRKNTNILTWVYKTSIENNNNIIYNTDAQEKWNTFFKKLCECFKF